MVYTPFSESNSPALGLLNHHAAVAACGVQGKWNQDRCPGRVPFGEEVLQSSPILVGLRPGYSYTVHGSTNGAWACCMLRNTHMKTNENKRICYELSSL